MSTFDFITSQKKGFAYSTESKGKIVVFEWVAELPFCAILFDKDGSNFHERIIVPDLDLARNLWMFNLKSSFLMGDIQATCDK